MNDHNLHHHDPETDAIAQQLETLASIDRAAPSQGFEQRIMDSISNQIAPAPIPLPSPAAHPISFTHGWKFNIAAAVLVTASVSLLLWTSTRATRVLTPAAPEAQQTLVSLEERFDALDELTDFTDALNLDMDELNLLTDAMHTELSTPSVLMELSSSSLTEGSL